MPLHPLLWPYHGIKWNEAYYFFTKLVFGGRSSPNIFDSLSVAICWIAENNYNINNILHLLDDFLVIVLQQGDAYATMETLLCLFKRLCVSLAPHKTEGPTNVLECLGIILDTVRMEARLPVDKVNRTIEIIDSFSRRKSCTKRELLSLLGHLNFACRVIIPGRTFVSYLLLLASSVKKLHHHVTISSECRHDMDM